MEVYIKKRDITGKITKTKKGCPYFLNISG
jgi:hypothetical protein